MTEKQKKSKKIQTQLKDYENTLKRLQADFENHIKRTEKEKQELIKFANTDLIKQILIILDELEIASKNEEGAKMIYNKLKTTLESQGLKKIETTNQTFDHNFHEAIKKEGDKEIITKEVQAGYLLNNKLLRPAKVIIGGNQNDI